MKHLRVDWAGIQDTNQGHPEALQSSILPDEPVFVMRAKDPVSCLVVHHWATEAQFAGADPALVDRVHVWASEMEAYAMAKRASGEWGPTHAPDAPELLPYPTLPQTTD